jgi:hypothetical protein
MVATLVLALLTFTLYRFVSTTLTAIQISTEVDDQHQQVRAVVDFLQTQLNDISPRRPGVLTGAAFKFRDLNSDEITWLCKGGHGVMTGAAPGDYRVTLALQPVEKGSNELELGLRREFIGSESAQRTDADFFDRGSGDRKYSWLPLIRPMAAMKVRYFDARLNAPIERWTDLNARPSLVQIWLWRHAEEEPFEAVLDVPAARLQQQ